MKTITYLRLSLLIPFLVWTFGVLFFFLWSAFEPNGLGSDGPAAIAVIGVFFLFYVFGIFIWLLPYVLLCLMLLGLSFKSKAQVLIRVFAWSPFAMASLVLALVNMLSFHSDGMNRLFSNPGEAAENLLGSNTLFLILTLLWGYICVGIGYGAYKILQRLQFIRDGATLAALPVAGHV